MIKEVSGDILLTKAQVLAHGVAPNDDFHQGLALSLRTDWPSLYKDFRHYCQSTHPKAGTLWTWGGTDHRRIVCLFTQEAAYGHHGASPGRATIANVNHALKELHKLVEAEKFTSLAITKLATGVGGLDWKDVLPLIHKHLSPLNIPVLIYSTYHKGMAADEGL